MKSISIANITSVLGKLVDIYNINQNNYGFMPFHVLFNPITYVWPQSTVTPFKTPLGSKLNADTFWQFLTIPIDQFKPIK